MAKRIRQAEFTRWMGPVLDALRQLGGSAKPKQVTDWIVQALSIPKEQLEAKMNPEPKGFTIKSVGQGSI